MTVAKTASGIDIGQTVVIKEGTILAVEAFEGTDETIRRAGRLGGRGCVVVKVAKQDHDMRFDIPVVGLHTMKVLRKAGLSKEQIDVWEVNEAFAVVVEKFIRDLDLDRDRVNPNGGAIALGHPIAATGAILIGTALDELERSGGRYGLITMCAAGGMAPAIIIERV